MENPNSPNRRSSSDSTTFFDRTNDLPSGYSQHGSTTTQASQNGIFSHSPTYPKPDPVQQVDSQKSVTPSPLQMERIQQNMGIASDNPDGSANMVSIHSLYYKPINICYSIGIASMSLIFVMYVVLLFIWAESGIRSSGFTYIGIGTIIFSFLLLIFAYMIGISNIALFIKGGLTERETMVCAYLSLIAFLLFPVLLVIATSMTPIVAVTRYKRFIGPYMGMEIFQYRIVGTVGWMLIMFPIVTLIPCICCALCQCKTTQHSYKRSEELRAMQ